MVEKAIFAAGCFWGVQTTFDKINGVIETKVGYTGGDIENPTYEQVCSKTTGHAEAIEITYDPDKVSYDELLDMFWRSHDPTTVNRQGPDIGTQYRSAIFFTTKEQETIAKKSKEEHQKIIHKPIVTEIASASTFYEAEEYHQKYLEKRGRASCHI